MKWAVACKENEKLFFCCGQDEFDAINEIFAPFINCEYDVAVSTDAWKISTGNVNRENLQYAVKMKTELVDLEEPEREIYILPFNKEIILKRPVNKKWRVQILVRLIRDVLRNLCVERHNYLHMHAAMVQHKGCGICYLGDKKSGKTSFMFSMLLNGSDFVSNDDLSFVVKDNTLYGVGWPRAISVRNDLFETLSISDSFLGKHLLQHPSNKNQLSKEYTFFYPRELVKVTSSEIKKLAPVDLILIGSFCEEGENASIVKVDDEDLVEKLVMENMLLDYNKHSREFESVFKMELDKETYINTLKKIPTYIIKQDFKNMSRTLELLNGIKI